MGCEEGGSEDRVGVKKVALKPEWRVKKVALKKVSGV